VSDIIWHRRGKQAYWKKLGLIAKELHGPRHWKRDEDFNRVWIEHADHNLDDIVSTLDYILRKHGLTISKKG